MRDAIIVTVSRDTNRSIINGDIDRVKIIKHIDWHDSDS